ncbi:hypothetical protein GCM10010909_25900 [Acidocella aquatica]|uniref:Uncharacterized protein n=1 Tax=Acidocella aquatica TaxID=1922313 RepID=A0ABQ6A6V4_9PROT|nr:hypothetical protein [Acidocella aquatica]GLR67909.1 hypothetical protein GCM10010909_25900 [Acidocella aquatica]
MNKTAERLCAYSGVVFSALLGVGLLGVTTLWQPPAPGLGAGQIARLFQQNTLQIRLGVAVLAAGSAFYWPFAAAITTQMRRIEGKAHSLAETQMATATGTVIAVLLACFLWFAAAYRPGVMPPAIVQSLNDLGWLCFVGLYPPAVLQCVVIGVCILSQQPETMIYPRWLGFVNFWAAIIFLPGAAVPFFQSGPFAWNGLVSFWLVAGVFFGWIILMSFATAAAIKRMNFEG